MPAVLAKNCHNWTDCFGGDCGTCGRSDMDYSVAEDDFCGRSTPDPIDFIERTMRRRGMDRKQLEPIIGTRGRVAEILNRKRKLTLKMIRNIRKHLDISADNLITDYDLK